MIRQISALVCSFCMSSILLSDSAIAAENSTANCAGEQTGVEFKMAAWENDAVLQRFREYLRIPSVHPDVDYDGCVKFLKKQASELSLPVQVYELVPKKPVVVISWPGLQPQLPAILLNSHMDVVQVYEEFWTYPPFDAAISEDGFIFARGAVDMKSVGMFHLEAVRRLKDAGVRLQRTVHVSFVPDEEIGSVDGMMTFAKSEEFKALNVGFGLDESGTSQDQKNIMAFYGERTNKQIEVTCRGTPGHGALFVPNNAGEKIYYMIDKLMKYRAEEKKKFDAGAALGDTAIINLTQMKGGVQVNVVPESLSASFDIRIPPSFDHDAFDKMIETWCVEAGSNVTFKYLKYNKAINSTSIDASNHFWTALKMAVEDMGFKVEGVICPETSDALWVRQQGIPVIGFSPILNTSSELLHAHNERIHVDIFKQGIDIMEKVLQAIYYMIDKLMKYRAEEKKKFDAGAALGDTATINLTQMKSTASCAGEQTGVEFKMAAWENDAVLQRFREYLRIPSVHPDVDYDGCVKFLKKQASELALPVQVYELVPKKPVVVISWPGLQPQLPAILLNSHMDVVPVFEEFWTYPPFDAVISDEGFIFARGAVDMKSVGMFHLEAVRRLKDAGVRLQRTVHVCFVPDEEIGSVDGMKTFAKSEEFKALNVGFGLDESGTNQDQKNIMAFYGERTNKQIEITCRGTPGHGALFVPNTAGEKIYYMIDKLMKYRAEEKKKFDAGAALGDTATINLTQMKGGVQVNVVPESLSASFDIRIPPSLDHDAFDKMIETWCVEAGSNVTFKYLKNNKAIKSTSIDASNHFWTALKMAVEDMGFKVEGVICPGSTDALWVRQQGIPVIGFSPILNTSPGLLHAHNERIHVDIFKQGIDIMEKVLHAVANV